MSSPTARTLAECKKREWMAYVTEKWIPQMKIRVDCWGFGDILALDGMPGALLIQATTTANMASRVTKIREQCASQAARWLAAGNRIEVWGWAKRGGEGQRKLWTLRVVPVTDIEAPQVMPARVHRPGKPSGRRRQLPLFAQAVM